MKKTLISISVIVLIILSITIYWNLPIEITRKSDIKSGNKIVENIENYRKNSYKLPEVNDWQTLEQLGLQKDNPKKPVYNKDETGNYEMIYDDGLGGPYLLWNSTEKKWTIDQPKIK
ncbi:hypothetical protein [Chryseobacterium indoltheticum]|jgi:hypothetical protein|uniref:hypothetical protein n=1 Tax=Chryseobacterium indoltheticum TaxID=254 RepID=UPI00242D368B|nr:hypothetical protein [Chryseobacterium indoltheticum]MDF2831377.1 hypothetical protein [Chryseobacterium indoltheticum]